MERLDKGDVVHGISGIDYQILKFLDNDSYSSSYLVNCGDEQKILKWYDKAFSNYGSFYRNIKENFDKGAFSACFWYPKDITAFSLLEKEYILESDDIDGPVLLKKEDAFGCIFDILPSDYVSLSHYLGSSIEIKFKDISEIILKLLSAFRIMHSSGYCYHNLNDNEIHINFKTKEVLITGFENIMPSGLFSNSINKARYTAPELYEKFKGEQTVYTSRYSLHIILFMLTFRQHPLEGKKWLVPCLNSLTEENIYSRNPVFIMDALDRTNEAEPDVHKQFINIWNYVPQYLRDLYLRAFNKDSFVKPNARLRETDFLKVYARLNSDIIVCDCGNEIFSENKHEIVCDKCKKQVKVDYIIKFTEDNYCVAAQKGKRLFKCQFGVSSPGKELQTTIFVIARKDDENILGLKNVSAVDFIGTTPTGRTKVVPIGTVVPFVKGIKLDVFGTKIELDET